MVLTEVWSPLLIWIWNLPLIQQFLIQILLEVGPARMTACPYGPVAAAAEVWVSVMVATADLFEVVRRAVADPDPAPAPPDNGSDAASVAAGIVSAPHAAAVSSVPLGTFAPVFAAHSAAHDSTAPVAAASALAEPTRLAAVEVADAAAVVAVGTIAEREVGVAEHPATLGILKHLAYG